MRKFRPGDNVKLSDRFAAVLNSRPQCRVDWANRRGVVHHANASSVIIMWAGRASEDKIPLQAVVLA